MTEKRYVVKDKWIKDNYIGRLLNIDFNTITDAVLCCDLLNQIEKEKRNNGKLASKLLEENEELKQFQDRVFSWIDMHLQRLPTLRDDEFESDNEFADPSLYSGALQILETMKRKLKGDVE